MANILSLELDQFAISDASPTVRFSSGGTRGVGIGRTGTSFSKLDVTSAASTEVIAGEVATVFTFEALAVVVYTGSTKISTARTLTFTDGDAGTELGLITIPVTDDTSSIPLFYKVVFSPVASLTSANGLFSVLSGALGTGGFYSIMGIVWKV